jgi:primosomal protein N' (replication factor Y)
VALPAVEALVRWDPAWLAARELAERRELGLPPAARVAQLTGGRRALEEALEQADLPASAQVLGPVPLVGGAPTRRQPADGEVERAPADHHVLVRVPATDTAALTRALLALKAFRSARKETDVVTVRVDPLDTF